MKTRKQRQIALRYQLILDQSIELIHNEGISSVRMERLAQLTEYSKGTIYQHITGREALLMAVSNMSLNRQLAVIDAMDSLSFSSVWAFAFGATYLNVLSASNIKGLCPQVIETGLIKLISTGFDAMAWEPYSHE